MKIHPLPRKRNLTFNYNIDSSENRRFMAKQKKLHRLPHIFAKVIELPFHYDADVIVQENPSCFRFIVITDDFDNDVRAHTIEIHPGVTKIVVGRGNNVIEFSLGEFELDLWRYRLPPSTKPELAHAVYVDGELIITVPKEMNSESSINDEEEVWGEERNGEIRGKVSRFVIVQ